MDLHAQRFCAELARSRLVNDGASLLDGSEQEQALSVGVWLDARGDPPAAAAGAAAPDLIAAALFFPRRLCRLPRVLAPQLPPPAPRGSS